jgi:preprotein translocase subunit SecF
MTVLRRLYRGETNIDFIGNRKKWYIASGILIAICILSFSFRGFHYGIEFAGGNQFVVTAQSGTTLEGVRSAIEGKGVTVASAQEVGRASNRHTYVFRTPKLTDDQRKAAQDAIVSAGKVRTDQIAATEVSPSWGGTVTNRALLGLGVFLILVALYLWIRFERQMSLAALGALAHDLILTAGVYSLSGFEVTPATIIGLLTILGFSLYDTVVVFDKVDENTRGLLGSVRYTYGEAANLAVNQTLMRSINTSIIALLPVAGLLFVGVGILGVGTLKDLALVLFVGLATGAYSSMFLATPWLVDLKMLDPKYKMHAQRVLARRAGVEPKAAGRGGRGSKAAAAAEAAAAKARLSKTGADDETEDVEETEEAPVRAKRRSELAGSAPRTGARPTGGRGTAGGRGTPRKRQGKRR